MKKNIFFFFGHFFCLEKLCGPHSVARCKTNEKYDVCSSEGAIRWIRLQSQLLIWFLIFPKYFPSITSYFIVLYCIAYKLRYWFSSLIFFTRTPGSKVADNYTLHLKCAHCEQLCVNKWTWNLEKANLEKANLEKAKAVSGLSFQKTEGADWRKTPLENFLLEKEKIPWKVCPGLKTKTHWARSSDSNKMHRGYWLK